jgi:uridylate kinase
MISRAMRRLTAIIVGACATGALAGCGTTRIDPSKVANSMRQVLERQYGVRVRSVVCPGAIKAGKGITAHCTATLADGDTVGMAATQTNGSGLIQIAPTEIIAERIENLIEHDYATHRLRVTAVCPQHVRIVVGRTFLCTAADHRGHSVNLTVTIRQGGGFVVGATG